MYSSLSARERSSVYPLSVAPMMDRTDRHFRYLLRTISRRTLLYSEMVTSQAIVRGDRDYLLGFDPLELPLVLQVGGDDPNLLATCARVAADFGYSEINLNVGCPSDRVKNGNFGACLMLQPERVAEGIAAMMAATNLPVSIKHRIGVDDRDRYEDLANFVRVVATTGCRYYTVHARKAWLSGLSPKENREVPPLQYDFVYRLKADFPHLWIDINGGFVDLATAKAQLTSVDGVAIGRAAYDRPYLFTDADRLFYDDPTTPLDRFEVVEAMLPYIAAWCDRGLKLHKITRHMLQLFADTPGSRQWKQILTMNSSDLNAGIDVVREALNAVKDCQKDRVISLGG
jgi:tRNA-dihydrouridine synthase A